MQYVSDGNGKVTAVQVPIKVWKDLERKAEAFDIASSIRKGFNEMEQIEKGELKAKTMEQLLHEL